MPGLSQRKKSWTKLFLSYAPACHNSIDIFIHTLKKYTLEPYNFSPRNYNEIGRVFPSSLLFGLKVQDTIGNK